MAQRETLNFSISREDVSLKATDVWSACVIDIIIIETFMYEDCVNKPLERVAYYEYLGVVLNITRQVLCVWRNTEARNHCWRGYAISITYFEYL